MRRILALSLLLVSCKSPSPQGSEVKDSEVSVPGAAASECQASTALRPAKDYTAEQIHTVSTRCIFNDGFHDVRMTVLGETFEKVLNDGCNDVDSGFGHAIEVVIDGVRIPDVAFKVRGNTSKCNPKRQFKLKFDAKKAFSVKGGVVSTVEFPDNKNRRFFGVANLNLRASGNDPAMLRERISSEIFKAAAAENPASRRGALVYETTFTKFFVSFNRKKSEGPEGNFTRLFDDKFFDYKGVYTLAENIDETFLISRFGQGEEKLKGFYLFGASKKLAFFDRARYTREGWVPEYIDGKDDGDEEALAKGDAKLFELFDVLNENATDEAIEALIDVDAVVNYFAGFILTGHWDSMAGNGNNDLLYFDGDIGKWKIVTWDLDNSLGVIKARYDEMMRDDLYHPARDNPARLFDILFSDARPAFKERLRSRVAELFAGFYSNDNFDALVDSTGGQLLEKAESWEGLKPQLFQDVKNFAKARRSKLASQVGP